VQHASAWLRISKRVDAREGLKNSLSIRKMSCRPVRNTVILGRPRSNIILMIRSRPLHGLIDAGRNSFKYFCQCQSDRLADLCDYGTRSCTLLLLRQVFHDFKIFYDQSKPSTTTVRRHTSIVRDKKSRGGIRSQSSQPPSFLTSLQHEMQCILASRNGAAQELS
jgi:hypothetical protein